MLKKILKFTAYFLLAFTLYAFWMSPRLGGLLTFGKEQIDPQVYALQFDQTCHNQYNLTYPNQASEYEMLKNTYRLDSLVNDCKSDFERVLKIQSWVQSRWAHDSDNRPEKNDALYILQEAEKGRRFRCVEYSIVAEQCLKSLGFRVRGLGLMARDISEVQSGAGHVANEVYLNDLQKWVFIDPQFDVMTTKNGVPMNAVELQNCIAHNEAFEIINPNHTTTTAEYKTWIGPYLYYFNITINQQKISIWDRILGRKKQLILYPNGAEKPEYFQKLMRINTAHFTHCIKDFYPNVE
ncbi:MAG: transglutaminase domain-containing protein [Saprospiraceae bacterium]|nr:transglutaminase domain-containing protein [Saprospiraceae bacterium]